MTYIHLFYTKGNTKRFSIIFFDVDILYSVSVFSLCNCLLSTVLYIEHKFRDEDVKFLLIFIEHG